MPVLHRTHTVKALLPRYTTRFKCIGPQCEDSCCREWVVPIDKATYKAYSRNVKLAKAIQINPPPRTDNAYGNMKLQAGLACTMLDGSLCQVQKTFGAEALSHTCFSYPRQWIDVFGQYQESLELSCPEAARLALLAPDAFDFVEGTIHTRMDLVGKVNPAGFPPDLVNEIRIFCLNLMRIEGLALWQRLAMLGLFCESLNAPYLQHDHGTMRELLDNFIPLLEQGSLLDTLDTLKPDYETQAMLFSTLWGGMDMSGNESRKDIIAAVAKGLGADPLNGQVSGERLVDCYRQGVTRLPEALQAAPHLLDNYILNEMFHSLFPLVGKPFECYLNLVAKFGLLRLMLAARCNIEGALPDAASLVRTVQVHCRRFHHDPVFVARVETALTKHGWAQLDKLYALLRT